jgi:hypothetical protein
MDAAAAFEKLPPVVAVFFQLPAPVAFESGVLHRLLGLYALKSGQRYQPMSKMDTWFRKHDPRLPKDPSKLFVFRDGGPLVILRPKDAAVKFAQLEAIKDGTPYEIAAEAFDKALNDQPTPSIHRVHGERRQGAGQVGQNDRQLAAR